MSVYTPPQSQPSGLKPPDSVGKSEKLPEVNVVSFFIFLPPKLNSQRIYD